LAAPLFERGNQCGFAGSVLVVALLGLAVRLPHMAQRPTHTDEG